MHFCLFINLTGVVRDVDSNVYAAYHELKLKEKEEKYIIIKVRTQNVKGIALRLKLFEVQFGSVSNANH